MVVEADSITCSQCQNNLQLASLVVSLNERVARLEHRLPPEPLTGPRQARSPEPELIPTVQEPQPETKTAVTPPSRPSKLPHDIFQSDFWMNKIGMGLLLLALAFLFNYAVDQGWLTPAVRVAIGLISGTVLLGIGYWIYGRRRHFSQVLLGGGIVAYYFTGFAAFQLYELVPFAAAFGFMSLVTLLAFFLSLRQDEAVLSFIGIIGGLWTPFLLYTGADNIPGFIAHTCLLAAAAAAIYWFRGWQLLMGTAALIGWLFVGGSALAAFQADRWAIQGGVIFMLIAAWLIPVWRQIAVAARPDRWPSPRFGFADSLIPASVQKLLNTHVHLGTLIPPFLAMLMTWEIWSLDDKEIGIVTLVGAFIFGTAAWMLKQTQVRDQMWRMHTLTGILLFTTALAQLLDGDALFFAWAVEAAALQLAAARWAFPLAGKVGVHAFWAVVGGWLAARLGEYQVGTAVWNTPALVDLGVIGLAAIAPIAFRAQNERRAYWLAAHIALLAWMWRELGSIANGQGLVSIAWGGYALLLLGISFKFRFQQLRTLAIATLFLLAGKLILVDLAALKAVWRILLFAGVGGLFLLISYYYRSFLPGDEEPSSGV